MLCPSWVLVPQAVASMVPDLSLEKPRMLPIIINPRSSKLGIAILTSFDFLYMFISSFRLTLNRDFPFRLENETIIHPYQPSGVFR